MRFDVFYELAVPPFSGRNEVQAYRAILEELAAADAAGFGTAWLVEHHFMRGYSHSSAPDLVLAAAAQRTTRLRLGHAIVPLPYHHPVQVAERLATLDILSDGRVDFGFGRGFSPAEYAAFGVPMDESRARVEESLAILRAFFTGDRVRFHGRHYQVDDLDILPKIVQRPHPPLWMAAVSPDSYELAARLGVGVLVGPFKPWFMVKPDIARYREAWQRYQPGAAGGALPAPQVGMTVGLFCLEDGARAREIARTNITWFYRELLRTTAPVLQRLHAGYEYYRKLGSLKFLLDKAVHLPVLEAAGMVVAGDPAHCREQLEVYRDAGVDHLLCAIGAGGSPPALVIESMQTLARDVMPHFAA